MSLTLVIPVGNFSKDREHLLEYLNQSKIFGIPMILVIDDSNPDSIIQARKLEAQRIDQRVRVLQYDGRNPGGARNEAIKYVQTQWLQFCDSDDSIDIESVLKLINSQEVSNCQAIVAGFRQKLKNDQKFNPRDYFARKFLYLGIGLDPGIWRWIFRTEFVKNLKFAETRMGEDQVFIAKFLLSNPKLINKQNLSVYSYDSNTPGNLTSQYSSEEVEKALKEFETLSLKDSQLRNSILVTILYFKMKLTIIRRNVEFSKIDRFAMYLPFIAYFLKAIFLTLFKRLERLGIDRGR